MKTFQWPENGLDNLLFEELAKAAEADERVVRTLIERGANVNAINRAENTVLMVAIDFLYDGLGLEFIRVLLKMGADVNQEIEGFNCLFAAGLSQRPEVVELLLQAGANPNCISHEDNESLLDWAEFDQFYEETCSGQGQGGGEAMAAIVALLKRYGAKSATELLAAKNPRTPCVPDAKPGGSASETHGSTT